MKKTEKELIKKIKSYNWENWLERPFGPFMLSLFEGGNSKNFFNKIGVKGVECEAFLYETPVWYQSKKVFDKMDLSLEKYFKKHSIFDITKSLETLLKNEKIKLKKLVNNKKINNFQKLKLVHEVLTGVTTYIWLAHGVEHYYSKKLYEVVPKYVKGDIDLFIGDASFPKKKNAYQLFDEAIIRKENPQKIIKKFGWLRVRDGFSDPFTVDDIRNYRIEKNKPRKNVIIPKPLKKIFLEISELVYFRTKRTDVFYELLFVSRPIIKAVGVDLGIEFAELRNHTITSLIRKSPKKYGSLFSAFGYKNNMYYFNKSILKKVKSLKTEEIKGMIAQKGVVRGVVKIVKDVSELNKVKIGDILVAQMTFPSFVMAMRKAIAFVTDEGGITCHAAIVAREMNKPCIIGTKNATKILKDGDMVEVDADKGIVKIIK